MQRNVILFRYKGVQGAQVVLVVFMYNLEEKLFKNLKLLSSVLISVLS
jgi:hypothetical protein